MKSTSLLVPRSRKVRQHKIGCFGQRWQRVVCTCVKTRNTQLLSNLPYHDCNRYRNLSTLNVSLFLNYLASMFLLILGGIIMLIIFTKKANSRLHFLRQRKRAAVPCEDMVLLILQLCVQLWSVQHLFGTLVHGCIWRGVRGFDPPARGSWPPESSAEPLLGVDSNPPKNPPDSIFLLNQYIYVQLYAAYASIETDVI